MVNNELRELIFSRVNNELNKDCDIQANVKMYDELLMLFIKECLTCMNTARMQNEYNIVFNKGIEIISITIMLLAESEAKRKWLEALEITLNQTVQERLNI